MEIYGYGDYNMQKILHQEIHLVNIYQCDHLGNEQLELVVLDSVLL